MFADHVNLGERIDEPDELSNPVAEVEDEEAEDSTTILHTASFEELASSHVQYDTIIWVLISLLLILAWGVGIIMLLCIPVRRYVLRKDILSRKLYVTPQEIVYKVVRPSCLPFLGFTKTEKHIPLPLVIDIIIEQGCLQSIYGIHTFRVESIARGKAAPVDELQVQGVSDPVLLRKVILTEAYRCMQEVGASWRPTIFTGDGESTPTQMGSIIEAPTTSKSLSSKVMASPQRIKSEPKATIPSDLLLHKLEEVKQSVKRIETLVEGSGTAP